MFPLLLAESRYVLLPMVVEQLRNEMTKSEEMKICIDILNDILITLTRKDVVSLRTRRGTQRQNFNQKTGNVIFCLLRLF